MGGGGGVREAVPTQVHCSFQKPSVWANEVAYW